MIFIVFGFQSERVGPSRLSAVTAGVSEKAMAAYEDSSFVVERGGIAGEHCPIAPILKSFDFVDHSVVFRHVFEPRVPITHPADRILVVDPPRS
jgi:hypothetical protein